MGEDYFFPLGSFRREASKLKLIVGFRDPYVRYAYTSPLNSFFKYSYLFWSWLINSSTNYLSIISVRIDRRAILYDLFSEALKWINICSILSIMLENTCTSNNLLIIPINSSSTFSDNLDKPILSNSYFRSMITRRFLGRLLPPLI